MRKRKYTKENLELAVSQSQNYSDVLRNLGIKLTGGSHSHIKHMISRFGIKTNHFVSTPHNKGKKYPKLTANNILVKEDRKNRQHSHLLTRALIEIGRKYECEQCHNNGTWCGKPITLDVDHIDRDWTNNTEENLRFLCPNCHHTTDNFGSKKLR